MTPQEASLNRLRAFLQIPSISTLPEHKPDVLRAADFVAGQLRECGLQRVEQIEGDGNPLVYGEWLGAPGRPTLLAYGHYDVQPPDPLPEWLSPPFEPTLRGDDIYARGASDDKGQTLILIEAVRRLMERDGVLPVNVRFLIEGEEETGGEHLERYVAARPPQLAADAALICDTDMFAPGLPTLCVGLRGIVYGELHVRGPRQDLHSGVYGGVAPNPIFAIAEILTALKDRSGHILIPGFYDRVRPPSSAERAAWDRLPFDENRYREMELGCPELTGEPGFDALERIWARPSLEVHGIRGGFTGEGAKTVIPATAVAKVSLRLVPDQDPAEVARQVQQAVWRARPRGVTAEYRVLHGAPPSRVDPDNRFIRLAAQAMEQVFGRPAVFTRSGGSIPVVGLFQRHLGLPSVLAGFGLPDDNLHAPNEKFHLPNFFRGIDTICRYLELLAE